MISNNDFEGTIFPYPESVKFEYKQAIDIKFFDKYIQIICGFLNSGGGNLIFGIKDDLNLIGLTITNKLLDQFILRIDGIIGLKQIIGMDVNTNCFVSIDFSHLKTRQFINKLKKKFLIIEIVPKSNIKYQLAEGLIFYRLNASNYFEKTEKILKQNDHENACKRILQKAEQDNKINIELFCKTLGEKDKCIEILNNDLINSKKTISIYNKYVENILSHTNINNNIMSTQPLTISTFNDDVENKDQIIQYDYNISINKFFKKFFPCLN